MAKRAAVKTIKVARVWGDGQWIVRFGKLNPGRGRPDAVRSLFRVVGEKLGNLKLTDQEEDDLVAFLKTLTDGYKVPGPGASRQ